MTMHSMAREALTFSAAENKNIGRLMLVTFLAIGLQVVCFPSLGWWASSLIAVSGTMPIVISLHRHKRIAVGALVLLAAISGPIYQFLVTLLVSVAFSVLHQVI